MAERPQAFLCPSPLKSVNNCTALFPPLCFVSSLVLGNIGGGGGCLVIQLAMFPGICKVYYLFWKHRSFIRVILGHLLSPHFSFRTQCAFFNFFVSTQEFHKTPANWISRYYKLKLNLYFCLPHKPVYHKGPVFSHVSGQHLIQRVSSQCPESLGCVCTNRWVSARECSWAAELCPLYG